MADPHALPVLPDGWIAGIDVGRSQGTINVLSLLAAGLSFAYVRATDGLHDVDPELQATASACDSSGLPWGPYAVIEPYGRDHAIAQADHLLETLLRLPTPPLPIALDFELGKGRTAVDLLESACAWMDHVADAAGRSPILYAGPAFLMQLEALGGAAARDFAARLTQRPLWVAHYTGSLSKPPRVPAPWQDWAVWQVSGDGGISLPGGRGWVDLDVFRGSVEELQGLGVEHSDPTAA